MNLDESNQIQSPKKENYPEIEIIDNDNYDPHLHRLVPNATT